MKSRKLGILGGGQLGRMLISPCIDLGVTPFFLDPDKNCPVSPFTKNLVVGSFQDADEVFEFGKDLDRVTIEIEHVSIEGLERLERHGVQVFPKVKSLKTIQDKSKQKAFYRDHNIPSSAFEIIDNPEDIKNFPIVQKTCMGGYDGKGVQILKSAQDKEKAFKTPSIIEELIDVKEEIGQIVVRGEDGQMVVFPCVKMNFCPQKNLVTSISCSLEDSLSLNKKCEQIAKSIAEKMEIVGVLAVEFFVTENNEILVNEIAPRVHNSGHLTIEGTTISQFEAHIRAVMGDALPESIDLRFPTVMINLVGVGFPSGDIFSKNGVYLHWYGKSEVREGRKMGHITICSDTLEKALKIAQDIQNNL